MSRFVAKSRANHKRLSNRRQPKLQQTKRKKTRLPPSASSWLDTLLDYLGGFVALLLVCTVIVSLAVIFRNIAQQWD